MDRYEISLWEDYPDNTSPNTDDGIPFLNERKICVIGSDTMRSLARATEPCLVSNVNGTHTFSFKIYYRFKDEITGEDLTNPFLPYIINERKVKVLWKDIWYDFVIKKIEEDSAGKYITCICEDLFITELSKNGYELEFNSELQNNSGTAGELVDKVLEGSGWSRLKKYITIKGKLKEVYEAESITSIDVINTQTNKYKIIPPRKKCLLIKSDITEDNHSLRLFYTSDEYVVDANNIVTNAKEYLLDGDVYFEDGLIIIIENAPPDTEVWTYPIVFIFDENEALSEYSCYENIKVPADLIYQLTEEPVYEVITEKAFNAIKQSPNGDTIISIPSRVKCLLYQSSLDESNTEIQFLYSKNGYATEINSMLVTNGDCCKIDGIVHQAGGQASIYINNDDNPVFSFDISDSFSSKYRAERLVNSQVTIFDDLLGRYVDVYNDGDVYGYETTEYSDPTLVINLLANSSGFKDTKGWIGDNLTWRVYPPFTGEYPQTVENYTATSYLQINSGLTYNTAFVSNKKHLTPNSADIKNGILGGIQAGEEYIFRYKAKSNLENKNYITSGITGNVYKYKTEDSSYIIDENDPNPYFNTEGQPVITSEGWVEYTLKCERACPANELEKVGFFLDATNSYWIEDIEFFKLAYGKTEYGDEAQERRIEPGMIALQSIANIVYRYYNADHDGVEDAKDLKFLYQNNTKSDEYVPVYNNYEKITSIEESKSNRFNILQSIAEKFECWVRFEINHDQETGQVLYDENGLPQKYVSLVQQIGNDTGISFEYGIDLRGIKRTIVSNTIATKAIIIPNENQFGKNGFCTIARSSLNYPRENFIINFDYYINQGLLDRNIVEADLYKTNGKNLGYYFWLNKWNREYDELASAVNIKKTELIKQQAELKVQSENYRASLEKLGNNQSDVMSLANGQFLMIDKLKFPQRASAMLLGIGVALILERSKAALEHSVSVLKDYIDDKTKRMEQLVELTSNLHKTFFQKYSRYLQEGTWQDSNYVYDDDYYLDALEVAYRSSRPQIQYDISLIRVSSLEDFSSKVFDVGDTCYIQDREFFGYEEDKITPYKQKVIISELTSYFDSPEKDIIKVQNYKTQFDDLFHRITTTTQSLQFAQGSYERAAGVVKPDGTLSFGMLQDTFDYNKDLVMNSANQAVTWDNTGITVSDESNSALKVRIIAGGIFVSDDGGDTWKNAIRGDGISTDLLTAGKINTSEIFVYDGNHQSFRWDSQGINAYFSDATDITNFGKFVRFDRFGLYGYQGDDDFNPATEGDIWDPDNEVKFGLTWRGFFLRGNNDTGSSLEISDDGDGIVFKMLNLIGNNSLEISTSEDIVLKTGNIKRIQIGRLDPYNQNSAYGIWVRDGAGHNIFNVSSAGDNTIGGWNLTENSFYQTDGAGNTIGLYSGGSWASIQGNNAYYYIRAGNNFGVTLDGHIYAAGGKIAGWDFLSDRLYNANSNTVIQSGGYNNNGIYTINTDSLKAIGGQIGGWGLSSTELTGGSVKLDSSGYLYFNNGSSYITTHSTGTVHIYPGLNVSGGAITTNNYQVNVGTSYFAGNELHLLSSGESYAVLKASDISYLQTLNTRWGDTTPQSIRWNKP